MTQEVLKLALEKIATVNAMDYEYQAWAREALREHAMREVQRLGQEIEQEPVDCEKLALLGWQAVECSICGSSAKAFTKPEQEPVAWEQFHEHMAGPFYTAPPQRTWVGSGDLEDSNAYLTSPQRTEQEPVKWSDYEPDGIHHNKPAQQEQL